MLMYMYTPSVSSLPCFAEGSILWHFCLIMDLIWLHSLWMRHFSSSTELLDLWGSMHSCSLLVAGQGHLSSPLPPECHTEPRLQLTALLSHPCPFLRLQADWSIHLLDIFKSSAHTLQLKLLHISLLKFPKNTFFSSYIILQLIIYSLFSSPADPLVENTFWGVS